MATWAVRWWSFEWDLRIGDCLPLKTPTAASPSHDAKEVLGDDDEGRRCRRPSHPCEVLRLLAGRVADELRAASGSVGVDAQQRADVASKELQLLHVRLEWHQVTRHQDAGEVPERHLHLLLSHGDHRALVLSH